MKYTYFECVYGDRKDGNDYMNIDGYPRDTDESGRVIATVYYTPHEDFVIHFNSLDYPYEELSAVKELIESAKEDLITARNQKKHMSLDQKITAVCSEECEVFKVDDEIFPTLETDESGQKYLNIEIDTSIEVRATIAEECMPDDVVRSILHEAECDSLTEAIEIGGADLSISFRYYKDAFVDELTLKEANIANDPMLCDMVWIACEDFSNMQTYTYQPHNQKWFRDFLNEELSGMNMPHARDLISNYSAEKKKENVER